MRSLSILNAYTDQIKKPYIKIRLQNMVITHTPSNREDVLALVLKNASSVDRIRHYSYNGSPL